VRTAEAEMRPMLYARRKLPMTRENPEKRNAILLAKGCIP
jgi:hypothetical protein